MFSPLISVLVCALTAFITYRAFKDPEIKDRLIFEPRLILGEKQWYRMVTSALIHADWMHLLFNIVSFLLFAEALEAIWGGGVLVAIYVAAILGGSALSLFLHRHQHYRALGASGGVSGIIFASIFLLPGSGIGYFLLPVHIPGWAYALLYLAGSFIAAKRSMGNIGHDAHFGGAVVGLLAALVVEPAACLAYPLYYFGALALAMCCLAAFIIDPFGLRMAEYEGVASSQPCSQRYSHVQRRIAEKAELDALLDQVAARGLRGLSSRDRERLEQLSQTSRRR